MKDGDLDPVTEAMVAGLLKEHDDIGKAPVLMDFATLEKFTQSITKLRDENTRLRGELAEATSLMARMLMMCKKQHGATTLFSLAKDFVLRMPKATQ